MPWDLSEGQAAEARSAFAHSRARRSRIPTSTPLADTLVVSPPRTFRRVPTNRLPWSEVQKDADGILAAGLRHLLAQPRLPWEPLRMSQAGVYVFSDGETTAYVGESTSVSWRVSQHLKSNSRLMESLRSAGIIDPVTHAASAFEVRVVPVSIGRLELEEIGIACLHPTFNLMRRASRSAHPHDDADVALWLRVEEDFAALLREGAQMAAEAQGVAWTEVRPPPGAGLYILRGQNGEMLYVGESDALAERLGTHRHPRSYFSALRRHVGTELLGLAFAPEIVRGFRPIDEAAISDFLSSCTVAIVPLAFGRWELERHLVQTHRPLLNREHAVESPTN
jgi:predicted GIY-YIG superfamily endonuclease